MRKNWTSKEELFPGVWVYKNVFSKDLNLIERVEDFIANSSDRYSWQEAMVGYMDKIPEYRDCVDFKIQKNKSQYLGPEEVELNKIWQDAYDAQLGPVEDYCGRYSIRMTYWEAMNFIRYGVNQHFQEHADHGFSYMATVSLVGYPNDGYVGGELVFPKLGLTIKPEAGDLVIFPSTYLFSHRAMPVKEGVKYSIVTMLDYTDHAHNEEFYRMREKWVAEEQK